MTIEQQQTIRDMRDDGVGYMTIANALNLTRDKVRNYCVSHGLNGRRGQHQDTGKSIEEIQEAIGGNWTVLDKKRGCECSAGVAEIKLQCNVCGGVRATRLSTVSSITCLTCKANRIEAEQARKQKEREAKQRKRLEKSYKQQSFSLYECKQCGKYFASMKPRIFCSDKCSRRHHDRTKDVKRRARLKSQLVDRDISLQRLYDRDNGVCYICGGLCDWNDCERKGKTFYAGNMYPSIDHVIPLARNGKHAWSNVRLAHKICNSVKSAK